MAEGRRSRWLLGALVAFALIVVTPATSIADDDADTNNVQALAQADGEQVFAANLQLVETTGGTDALNLAQAYASCVDCKAVAIAFQVVLVSDATDASAIDPQNAAVAVNDNCTGCKAVAHALQIVKASTRGDVELSRKGERKLERVNDQLQELDALGPDPVALQAAVDEAEAEVRAILDKHLRYEGERRSRKDKDADVEG